MIKASYIIFQASEICTIWCLLLTKQVQIMILKHKAFSFEMFYYLGAIPGMRDTQVTAETYKWQNNNIFRLIISCKIINNNNLLIHCLDRS